VTADYRYQGLAARVAEFQRAGYAVTGELCLTIFERAWQMRGMEGLMMDFLANPGMAHAVCQRLADFRVEQARRFARDGVDILRLGDDVCMQQGLMMSLDVYRTFFKERIRTIVTAAKEVKPDVLVFMHCDGCVEEVIQEYIDIGIDILNPIQPECNSLARIAARFGGRIAFWGGIGTQSTMPFGTPAQVHAKVREVKQVLGRQGGLLIAPSHVLEPDVPWQNVLAFVEAIQNARYD
jgi:uroporphyrinogen decarboxylase